MQFSKLALLSLTIEDIGFQFIELLISDSWSVKGGNVYNGASPLGCSA